MRGCFAMPFPVPTNATIFLSELCSSLVGEVIERGRARQTFDMINVVAQLESSEYFLKFKQRSNRLI